MTVRPGVTVVAPHPWIPDQVGNDDSVVAAAPNYGRGDTAQLEDGGAFKRPDARSRA